MNWTHFVFLGAIIAGAYYVGANHKLGLPFLG